MKAPKAAIQKEVPDEKKKPKNAPDTLLRMLELEKKVMELAVKIADLLAECPSLHDAQAACGIAQEIVELRVRKISFGRVDHRLA